MSEASIFLQLMLPLSLHRELVREARRQSDAEGRNVSAVAVAREALARHFRLPNSPAPNADGRRPRALSDS